MCDTKNPFLSRKKLFFQQKNLFLGEKLEKLSWNLETVKQKESMFVHVFNVFSLIFFLGEKLFSGHSFSGLFFKKFTKKKVFFSFYSGFMCETELKLIFYVWHQEKLWFSMKNIFDFFSGEKNLYVKPSWKLFFKTCFLCHVWNRIETKWR